MFITLSSEHEARLVLAKAKEQREALSEMGIYLLPALSKDDAIKENLILKNRRDLLNQGVAGENLKIRNSQPFNDGVKVDINSEPDAQKGKCLAFLNLFLFNAKTLFNSERRFKLANAVLNDSFHVLCIYETWLTKEFQNS